MLHLTTINIDYLPIVLALNASLCQDFFVILSLLEVDHVPALSISVLSLPGIRHGFTIVLGLHSGNISLL